MTSAYAAGQAYDLAIPDLSGAGFDPTWALQSDVAKRWSATAVGGSFGFGFPGQRPIDGASVILASRWGLF
jgi:hypothetical protein